MKALLFDFGGTLDTDGVHWSEKFWEVYQRLGVRISKAEFEEGYVAAESRMSQGIVSRTDTFRVTLRKQIALQFEELRARGKLSGDDALPGLPERIAGECFEDVRRTIRHVSPVLEACRRRSALGLVSNFYGNLATVCEELHIHSLFSTIVDSACVGVSKPDPKIFQIAMEQLGAAGPDTLVVGDSYDRDIVPAKSLGCTTVWLRGKSWTNPTDTSSADYVIHSLKTVRSFLPPTTNSITTQHITLQKGQLMSTLNQVPPATGKLGVLIPGLNGAVSTTFVAGTMSVRRKLAQPVGSLTQMATIRLGQRQENRFPLIREFVPLAALDDLVFGGWDIRDEDCCQSARDAKVLEERDILPIREELEQLRPMRGVFEQRFVTRLVGTWVKKGKTKYDLAQMLREDIRTFQQRNKVDRLVMIWCGSTEIYVPTGDVHRDMARFEKGMKENDPAIAPSMLYAYASLCEGVPFINGAPNLSVDAPALMQLAQETGVPIAGKDYKTGQTLMKTVIAPMLKARMLGLNGWFSTNILGNRDGEVLDDPESFKTKEESKLSVLEGILQPDLYPALYNKYHHKVRIHYYPPRGDNKEGWDNIDIFGWLGYPMQLKINFLCRDSILAAPIVLDLVLFTDLAKRCGMTGVQEWLSFYFKSPIHAPEIVPEHDLFIQLMKLKNTLRHLMGEKPVTHLDSKESFVVEDILAYS